MARHLYLAPLRWSDMDAYQHVNNVQFLRLLEDARVDLLFTNGPGPRVRTPEEAIIVVRNEIDYLAPLIYRPEPVLVETWTQEIRSAWFTLGYVIRDDDRVYAKASTRLACYDLVRNRPRRVSAEQRAYLEKFVEEA